MSNFEKAFNVLIGHEGGFSDRDAAADPGGKTMYGVTERVARAWGYTGEMHQLPLATAKAIAKKEYWDRYSCDQFPYQIAFQVFDTAYNGGHAVKWLQAAVGVVADGVIGAKTIAAVRAADPARVVARFNAERLTYLTGLSNWAQNSKGWARRIAANLKEGAA